MITLVHKSKPSTRTEEKPQKQRTEVRSIFQGHRGEPGELILSGSSRPWTTVGTLILAETIKLALLWKHVCFSERELFKEASHKVNSKYTIMTVGIIHPTASSLHSFFITRNCLKQSAVVILIVLSLKQPALPVLQESRVLRAKGAQLETKVSQVPEDSPPQLHKFKVCQTEVKH